MELWYLRKLGTRFRQIREQKGYSLEYVLKKSGITTVEDIENGIETDMKDLFGLCQFYKIDLTNVFNKK